MILENEKKELLKKWFEKQVIMDDEVKNNFVDNLFESEVIMDLLPEIQVNIQQLQCISKGKRGCLIYDGKYYYILSYAGKVFAPTTDISMAKEDFQKFDNNEEM